MKKMLLSLLFGLLALFAMLMLTSNSFAETILLDSAPVPATNVVQPDYYKLTVNGTTINIPAYKDPVTNLIRLHADVTSYIIRGKNTAIAKACTNGVLGGCSDDSVPLYETSGAPDTPTGLSFSSN